MKNIPPKNPHASLENINNFITVPATEFISKRDILDPSLFAFLTNHSANDYTNKNTKLFLSNDFKSGFGINPDGELISVFSLEKARGKILVKKAVKEGASYLECMGDKLLELYSSFGFSPVKITKWDNQFAPKNWNYERFGTPNIYSMRLIK